MTLKIYNSVVVFFDTTIIITFSKSEVITKIKVSEGMQINNVRQL